MAKTLNIAVSHLAIPGWFKITGSVFGILSRLDSSELLENFGSVFPRNYPFEKSGSTNPKYVNNEI
jgi:hypothetical protein